MYKKIATAAFISLVGVSALAQTNALSFNGRYDLKQEVINDGMACPSSISLSVSDGTAAFVPYSMIIISGEINQGPGPERKNSDLSGSKSRTEVRYEKGNLTFIVEGAETLAGISVSKSRTVYNFRAQAADAKTIEMTSSITEKARFGSPVVRTNNCVYAQTSR